MTWGRAEGRVAEEDAVEHEGGGQNESLWGSVEKNPIELTKDICDHGRVRTYAGRSQQISSLSP